MTSSSKNHGVDKNDISLIKSLAMPPELVKVELSVTTLLLGHPEQQAKVWLPYHYFVKYTYLDKTLSCSS